LGGNKKGFQKQLAFLLITMLIGGFWHGANWKFVFWGAGHGILLILHKLSMRIETTDFMKTKIFKGLGWLFTFSFVALLWVPFRASSMSDTWIIYENLFSGFELKMVYAIYETHFWIFLVLVFGYFATLMPDKWKMNINNYFSKLDNLMLFILFLIIIQVMLQFKSSTVQPFIYFQF
jgi:hypothetical protein